MGPKAKCVGLDMNRCVFASSLWSFLLRSVLAVVVHLLNASHLLLWLLQELGTSFLSLVMHLTTSTDSVVVVIGVQMETRRARDEIAGKQQFLLFCQDILCGGPLCEKTASPHGPLLALVSGPPRV